MLVCPSWERSSLDLRIHTLATLSWIEGWYRSLPLHPNSLTLSDFSYQLSFFASSTKTTIMKTYICIVTLLFSSAFAAPMSQKRKSSVLIPWLHWITVGADADAAIENVWALDAAELEGSTTKRADADADIENVWAASVDEPDVSVEKREDADAAIQNVWALDAAELEDEWYGFRLPFCWRTIHCYIDEVIKCTLFVTSWSRNWKQNHALVSLYLRNLPGSTGWKRVKILHGSCLNIPVKHLES